MRDLPRNAKAKWDNRSLRLFGIKACPDGKWASRIARHHPALGAGIPFDLLSMVYALGRNGVVRANWLEPGRGVP